MEYNMQDLFCDFLIGKMNLSPTPNLAYTPYTNFKRILGKYIETNPLNQLQILLPESITKSPKSVQFICSNFIDIQKVKNIWFNDAKLSNILEIKIKANVMLTLFLDAMKKD